MYIVPSNVADCPQNAGTEILRCLAGHRALTAGLGCVGNYPLNCLGYALLYETDLRQLIPDVLQKLEAGVYQRRLGISCRALVQVETGANIAFT